MTVYDLKEFLEGFNDNDIIMVARETYDQSLDLNCYLTEINEKPVIVIKAKHVYETIN